MKQTIYIVVDACSGEDYCVDEPTILFVGTDLKEAKQFFCDEIDNWEDGMTDFENDAENYDDGTAFYECTDFIGDSHRIMKLVSQEIELN